MKTYELHSNWVEVDLAAVQHNVHFIREHTGVQVMAVVKANAYGHGAVQVAQAALEAGAGWLGVARANEAMELRRAGLDCSILLLGYTPSGRVEEMIENRVSMTVWDAGQVRSISAAARRRGKRVGLHIKVDTGMSRLGAQPENTPELARELAANPQIRFEGIFTHFARADETTPSLTDDQEQRFRQLLEGLDTLGLRPPVVHAANSAASLTRPSAYFNLVRLGIAIYGLHPSPECLLPPAFRPALSWKAVLSQVKTIPPGRGVGYGHKYTTSGNERIGTLPVGYADGFRRVGGNQVLVGGQHVPVVGGVCMDQIMVQLDGVPEARAGDEVVLIGKQGAAEITAEEVAGAWGTINYEVTCAIGARAPRFYS